MKRILSLILAVALLCGVLPLGAVSAEETEIAYPVEGGNIYFDPATGTITDVDATVTEAVIPEQIEGVTVTAVRAGAFSDFGNYGMALKRVVLPETVTEIGSEAFYLCKTLEEVNIPSGVEVIPQKCFHHCESLTKVHLSEGLKVVKEWAFHSCTSLTEIVLPEGLETLEGGVFQNCTALTELSLPESVKSIGLNLLHGTPIFEDESNWTGDCLYWDGWLIRMEEKSENTELQVRKGTVGIADYVRGYASLQKIQLPEGLRYIGNGCFMDCTGLTEIVFPESLEKIGSLAFSYGNSYLKAYFKGDAPEIGEQAFFVFLYSFSFEISPYMCFYYMEGKEGWTSPEWNGYPTAIWEQPHGHNYVAVVTTPTCSEEGYTTYTCACGDSYVADEVTALGHDYQEGKCTRCGEADPDYKPVDPPMQFKDVAENAWYKGAVDYAVVNGLMNGVGDGKFEPESPMTRAMLVMVLWRYAGEPAEGKNEFSDVAEDDWYAEAVAWAAENGVVTGVGNGKFDPDGKITREQMATILYRYSKAQGIDVSKTAEFTAFPDGGKVSDYAAEALSWAVAEGLINGSDGKLLPQGNATRAQVATILMRYIETVME